MGKDGLRRIEPGTGRLLLGPSHLARFDQRRLPRLTLCHREVDENTDVAFCTPLSGQPNIVERNRCDDCYRRQRKSTMDALRRRGCRVS